MTNMDKPWNDVADQLRPARPDVELLDEEDPYEDDPAEVTEADPADVADQRRVAPLLDDPDDELP